MYNNKYYEISEGIIDIASILVDIIAGVASGDIVGLVIGLVFDVV